jgi:hypothetical protein
MKSISFYTNQTWIYMFVMDLVGMFVFFLELLLLITQ